MTFQAIIQRLQSAIAAHRIRATRRLALEQIARHPEHLARDLDTSDGRPRTGITVVLVSCRDQLDEIPPKALETPEPTQRLRFFTSVTSQTGYFHR